MVVITVHSNLIKEELVADIDLYVDPVCPFSWVTARWLLDAARTTHVPVRLRQMSLAVLNEGSDADAQHKPMIERSRQLGRLSAAVTEHCGPEAFSRLYDAVGTRLHVRGDEMTPDVIAEVLADNGFDRSLSQAVDDSRYDEAIRRAHEASQQVLGDNAGSPIIAVDGRAFFGPVLTEMPSQEDGVRLLEAMLTAARIPGFAVLQRPYQGPPTIEGSSR
jgi:hypothetical protein